jgi:osmoprotectant transport system permease protein
VAEAIRWDWISKHRGDIGSATLGHLQLVVTSVAVAVAIAIPIGVAVRRRQLSFGAVTTLFGVAYTIPSLALFAFLVPIIGIGTTPVVIALVVYSLLILVRNTVVGLRSVPPAVLETARGMGLTGWQTLTRVELPLAVPSIVSGIRIATVSAVGIATIGVLIDGGGLGELIYKDGINRDLYLTPILAGTVCATLLALSLDLGLRALERLLTPWTRRRATP